MIEFLDQRVTLVYSLKISEDTQSFPILDAPRLSDFCQSWTAGNRASRERGNWGGKILNKVKPKDSENVVSVQRPVVFQILTVEWIAILGR